MSNKELSPREKEVAELLTKGKSYQVIAKQLGISPATVRQHVHKILEKTGCATRVELAIKFWGEAKTNNKEQNYSASDLSSEQLQILKDIFLDTGNRKMAQKMGCSLKGIIVQIREIAKKFNVCGRYEIVYMALLNGIDKDLSK